MPSANANIAGIPRPDVPFLDAKTNRVQREWFRFLQNLFVLGGSGGNATTVMDLQGDPSALYATDMFLQSTALANAALVAPMAIPAPNNYRYGAFYTLTAQTAAAINTAYAITFTATIINKGVTLATSSQLAVDRPGVYALNSRVTANKTTAGAANLFLWIAKNGTNQTGSAIQVPLTGGSVPVTISYPYVIDLNAGDYVSLTWSTSSTDVQLTTTAASAPVPAIPSAYANLNRIGDI